MSDKNYHPDGFTPMKLTIPAAEGFGFMPVGDGVSLNNIAHPINPNLLETVEIELPDSISNFKPKWEVREQTPLTEEQVGNFTHQMILACGVHPNSADINIIGLISIVRAIERAHGIV